MRNKRKEEEVRRRRFEHDRGREKGQLRNKREGRRVRKNG